MVAQVNTASGSKWYIGETLTTTTPSQATYEAMTWIPVAEFEDAGTLGDSAADITFESMGDGRTRHFPGPKDAGTQTVTCGHVNDDPGQAAIATAFDDGVLTAFKLEITDRPDASHTNTIKYYGGRVLKFEANVGNPRNVVRRNISIGINTPVLEVAPQVIT